MNKVLRFVGWFGFVAGTFMLGFAAGSAYQESCQVVKEQTTTYVTGRYEIHKMMDGLAVIFDNATGQSHVVRPPIRSFLPPTPPTEDPKKPSAPSEETPAPVPNQHKGERSL